MTLQVVQQDLTKQVADTIVQLFEIDASAPEIGGTVMYFCNQNEANGSSISWKGQVYTPFPIEMSEVEYLGKGASNRPKLAFGNINGFFSALNVTYQDLLGAKVTRHRVLSKYLDGHASANTGAGLPDDVFFIDMKNSETKQSVIYELASFYDLDGLMLPLLKVNSDSCVVRYRGPECSFTAPPTLTALTAGMAVTVGAVYLANNRTYVCIAAGNASGSAPGSLTNTTVNARFTDGSASFAYRPLMTDGQGTPLTTLRDRGLYYPPASDYIVGDYVYQLYDGIRLYSVCIANGGVGQIANPFFWTRDVCNKRLGTGCKARFGDNNPLPYLAFPGASRMPYG